jgi:hypothetical protein
LCRIFSSVPFQPPASIRPRIGIKSDPNQIRKYWSTSLNTAEISPPGVTYTATVSEATQILTFMFHPSNRWRILAIANMLAPLTSTVRIANEIPARALLLVPYRSLRWPGTECALQM